MLYQIVPVIALNLFIGFSTPGIDNWAHLGGLAGGYLAGMVVGVNGKANSQDRINGIIVTILMIAFLTYMLIV
jgi:rhomboid protease GluP